MTIRPPLTDQHILRLHHALLAPAVVHDILRGHDVLDETARYTLDVMIAEFAPDTALLCVALCAAHIAQTHAETVPIANSLGFESARIVHEFGPVWLANADKRLGAADESVILDLLEQMPEDFEALADLLDATGAQLAGGSDSATLCAILGENAHAFAEALEERAAEEAALARARTIKNLEVHGNIITFPRTVRPD